MPDRRLSDDRLKTLLSPSSVAIIGANDEPRSFGGAPIHNLVRYGYRGSIFAVNPKYQEVQGIRCFPSVLDIPDQVDTAVVAVAARHVVSVLEQCAEKGISSVTVATAGFGEDAAGPEGKALARDLERVITERGLRVLGPNTTGVVNLFDAYVPRAAHNHLDPNEVRAGSVALVTQSGAASNIVFNRAQSNGVGVSISVATGDQADLDVWDLVSHLLEDDRIRTIMVILESFGSAMKFEQLAVRASHRKVPLIVLKLGQSQVGQESVLTHTGSLAGDFVVQQAAMKQLGVIQVNDFDELWEVARLIEAWGPPTLDKGGLGIISFSGGEAALLADQCEREGVALGAVTDEFRDYVATAFKFARAGNPFDVTGETMGKPELVKSAVLAFGSMNDFSAVLFASPVYRKELAQRFYFEFDRHTFKGQPHTLLSYWPAGELTAAQKTILEATGVPVFANSVRLIRAYGLYREYARRATAATTVAVSSDAHVGADGAGTPVPSSYFEVRELIRGALPLTFSRAALVRSEAEMLQAAHEIGWPLVFKGNAASTVHKSEHGLVIPGVRNDEEAHKAWGQISRAGRKSSLDGIVLEEFVPGDVQVFLGVRRDPEFGVVLVVGSGGATAEFVRDTAVGVARYLDRGGVFALFLETAVGRFLKERAPTVLATLVEVGLQLGDWVAANQRMDVIDLNPLIVNLSASEVTCVDARISAAV